MAPQRYPAAGAAHDLLSLAAAGRRVDGVRLAAEQFDTGGLDHRVERERAAGLALAPAAVAAMHEQRHRGEAVAHGAAGVPAFVRSVVIRHRGLQPLLIRFTCYREGDTPPRSHNPGTPAG